MRSEAVIETIKREFRKIDALIKVEFDELSLLLINDVLKRELLDTPDAIDANDKYQKILKKLDKQKQKLKELDKSNIEEKILVKDVQK